MSQSKVAVFLGDDASPEVMVPTIALLEKMKVPITLNIHWSDR